MIVKHSYLISNELIDLLFLSSPQLDGVIKTIRRFKNVYQTFGFEHKFSQQIWKKSQQNFCQKKFYISRISCQKFENFEN